MCITARRNRWTSWLSLFALPRRLRRLINHVLQYAELTREDSCRLIVLKRRTVTMRVVRGRLVRFFHRFTLARLVNCRFIRRKRVNRGISGQSMFRFRRRTPRPQCRLAARSVMTRRLQRARRHHFRHDYAQDCRDDVKITGRNVNLTVSSDSASYDL